MTIELINKLNIRSMSFTPAGGASKYDIDDVIDAIAHLPQLMIVYIYAMNESASNDRRVRPNIAKLQVHFATKLFSQIYSDKFITKKLSQIALADGITKATLHAHFYARGQCKACNGLGIVFENGGKKCGDCFGRGVKYISNHEKTRIAFPEIKFDRTWWGKCAKEYENIIVDELNEMHFKVDEALNDMQRRLRDDMERVGD